MIRSFDADLLNALANDPTVRPYVGGEGVLDLAPLITNPANFALAVEGGCFLLICLEPGIYEVHSMFRKDARSRSIRAMRDGFEYMFCRTDCVRIVTQVPDNNPAAAAIAKIGGFSLLFRREETARGPTSYMAIDLDRWIQTSAGFDADGERFHDALEAAKQKTGSELPIHADDQSHDRAVGAAFRMIGAGNLAKGVASYNRWARFAGYAPISIVSANPPTVDVVDAVVTLSGSDVEVLLCR